MYLDNEKIGKKIKILRTDRGLTQQQLADLLGCKRATVSNYEVGRRSPHITELERIAKVLHVSLDYFGVKGNEINELLSRAQYVFSSDDISAKEKSKVYKEIMRLYLDLNEE